MIARLKAIPRTGETELHQMGNLLERHGDRPFYATEKLDGFSMSFGVLDGQPFASARDRMIEPHEDTVFARAIAGGFVPRLFAGQDAICQGELIGPGIRGNRYGLAALEFRAFDLLVDGERAGFAALENFCREHGLKTVPVIGWEFNLGNISALACGPSILNPATPREGAVFRPIAETSDPFQGRVSFKVFNPAFNG